uniref:G_PROTEIN_RECEP_F1_2 domain-containing protein n=1 Tax=Heligmosomoides polygyrus TaxID=6339 RepID=A0A183FP74_HELPZ
LLLFVFLTKSSSNPFQTFLAFLDFMLCFLFITCFGALSLSVTLRIEWLYTAVKTSNVHMLIASRMVQLCIPYILIANTAYRLASVTERPHRLKQGRNLQVTVLIIAAIVVSLRLPGYFFIEVVKLPNCDFFESRILSVKDRDPELTRMYRISDVFIQFLHLFVSFLILCVLNCVVVLKLRTSHQRARRQSTCPTIFHASKRSTAAEEERREHKRFRCAVKTTIVIISSYLACNSVNFILYCIEMFNSSLTQLIRTEPRVKASCAASSAEGARFGVLVRLLAATVYCLEFQDEDGNFDVFYVVASDLGTNLFVLSSTIRIFVYYKYNPAIRTQIRSVTAFSSLLGHKKYAAKGEPLTATSL